MWPAPMYSRVLCAVRRLRLCGRAGLVRWELSVGSSRAAPRPPPAPSHQQGNRNRDYDNGSNIRAAAAPARAIGGPGGPRGRQPGRGAEPAVDDLYKARAGRGALLMSRDQVPPNFYTVFFHSVLSVVEGQLQLLSAHELVVDDGPQPSAAGCTFHVDIID